MIEHRSPYESQDEYVYRLCGAADHPEHMRRTYAWVKHRLRVEMADGHIVNDARVRELVVQGLEEKRN